MNSGVEAQKWAKAHFFVGCRFPKNRMREAIVARVTEIAERAGGSEGIEIVEVELLGAGNQRVLRIFIEKPGGVSHADCELISQQVGTILDVEDVIPGGRYALQVSSPGLERKLKKPRDFERSVGRKVRVLLRQPVENQRHWEGILAGFSGGVVTLEAAPGRQICFDLQQIERAHLKFDW
jgi:ribosome maturation factor RimP